MPLTILNTTIPDYPGKPDAEPCHLFCCNFLLHRENNNTIYHTPANMTPREYLIDTIHSLRLRNVPAGTPINPGDLIVISRHQSLAENIRHSMIALKQDIWFGSGNRKFFSHIGRYPFIYKLNARDAVDAWMLHADMEKYRFGEYVFDVWRK